jgi:hypothetical protein
VTQSDWDNTPWAGTPAAENHSLLVPSRPEIIRPTSRWEHVKAVGGPGAIAMTQGTMLDSMRGMDPQQRAKKFLQAYRVGWFFKAGRRISQDVGALEIRVAFQDSELDGDETVVKDPGLQVDLEDLEPEVQLVRLLNKPNPKQSGRAFRQEAQIRLDFAGSTFTYLEGVGEDPMALPTALYGISPARMWPARDKAGNIFGWVMDADKTGGGVPFSANEIIHTSNASEQDGDIWGVSIVEAVFAEVPLTALMARHTADVLSTGGRLAGMLWPKERTLDEGEFEDAQRAWRNVANDPNAARRLLMFPEPMEFNKGAATPAEIGIPELASLHQTQVLTAFPMSPQMLGVPAPAGLNSGETRRWDRREYWEGTIHPRAELQEEALDRELVGRYEQIIGKPMVLSLVERALDDAPALIEKVGAMRSLINLGFDPRDSIVAVGLTGIKWNGLPLTADPNAPVDTAAGSQGARTGGLRVLTGDTTTSDASSSQQELVCSRKSLDDILAGLPDLKAERIKGLPETTDVPEQVRRLLDIGLRRGYTNQQLADGVPSERFEGLRDAMEAPETETVEGADRVV